jgi:choline kinase/diacylglycerol kinase family enzyme
VTRITVLPVKIPARRSEKRGAMRAIILCAGQGRRLLPLTAELPKCLLPVHGDRPILAVQLEALAACGVREAAVVVGHGAAHVEAFLARKPVPAVRTTTRMNPFHDVSDNLVSAWLARDALHGNCLLLNGDSLFEPELLRQLLAAPPAPVTLAIQRKPEYDDDDMKVSLDARGRVHAISKTLAPSIVHAESIGLLRFRDNGPARLRRALDDAVRGQSSRRAYYLEVIDCLARQGAVASVDTTGLWWREVDCAEDLARAREDLARRGGDTAEVAAVAGPRVGVLSNLRAGRSHRQVARLLALLRDHPDVAHVETSCADAVPEALHALADAEIDVLVVHGGDGTLQRVLTELLAERTFGERLPAIAPLRGGRTNMTALDLGTSRDPVRGLAGILDAAARGQLGRRIVRRRVVCVEHGARRERIYGMFFGAGLIHRAIEATHRLFPKGARSQGVLGGTLMTAGLLARAALMRDARGILAPDKIHALLDGEPLDRAELTLAMATTLDRLFARMRPFWGEGSGGLRFTALAAGVPELARNAFGILRGRPGPLAREQDGYTSRNLRSLRLRMDCGFTVDGELIPPEPGRTLSVSATEPLAFVRG